MAWKNGGRTYGYKRSERVEGEKRHKPGTAYSCDARNFGGDKRLCYLHAASGRMFDLLDRIAVGTLSEARQQASLLVAEIARNHHEEE